MTGMDALVDILLMLGLLSVGLAVVMVPLRALIYLILWVVFAVRGRLREFDEKIWW